MKATLVFLLVATLGVAAINCAPQSSTSTPDVAQAVSGLLAAFKHMIPCGDASMGIPVLAPFRVPHVPIDVNEQLLTIKGSIDNLLVTGLGDFIEIGMSTNATTNRTSYDFLFKDIQILGEAEFNVDADLGGYHFIDNMVGLVNLQLKEIRFNGGFTLGTNAVGGVLEYDVVTYVQLGGVVSLTLNDNHSVAVNNYYRHLIETSLMLYVQEQREFLNEVLSNYITNQFNVLLYNVSPSQNIQAMINFANQWNAITCNV